MAKFKARIFTPEQIQLAKDNLLKSSNTSEQRMKARERMLALNEKKGIQVEVTDQITNTTTTYTSIRSAADALETDLKALSYNEKVQKDKGVVKVFKKYFIVKIIRS